MQKIKLHETVAIRSLLQVCRLGSRTLSLGAPPNLQPETCGTGMHWSCVCALQVQRKVAKWQSGEVTMSYDSYALLAHPSRRPFVHMHTVHCLLHPNNLHNFGVKKTDNSDI